jgi:hypothetical protein
MPDPKALKKKATVAESIFGVLVLAGLLAWGMHQAGSKSDAEASTDSEKKFVNYLVSTSPHVLVWRDEAAFNEEVRLYAAGVPPAKLLYLLACMPDSGVKAGVLSGGLFSSTIIVTSGKDIGCKGYVDNSFIKHDAPK